MPSRKRAKTGRDSKEDDGSSGSRKLTAIRNTRKSGKLARMLELPLEVFTEIASHLSPYDILQIARSSKSLRNMFMSKRSRHVWVAARASMGIPDYDDFSEPYYADLLLSRRCHGKNCEDNRATKVSYALGVRLCKKCLSDEALTDCNTLSRRLASVQSSVNEISKLLRVFPGSRESEKVILKSSVDNLIATYKECKSEEEKTKFISDFKANTVRLNKIGAQINSWEAQEAKSRRDANAALCIARRNSITEKLLSMGYTSADLSPEHDFPDWKWDAILNQPRLLTETTWKRICPHLEETLRLRMAYHRRKGHEKMVRSIENIFHDLRRSARQTDDIGSIFPVIMHGYFPSIKAMLDDPDSVGSIPENALVALKSGYNAAAKVHAKKVEGACAKKMKEAYCNTKVYSGTETTASVPNVFSSKKSESIDSVLLYATSLFKYEREPEYHGGYSGSLISYAGILKYRRTVSRSDGCDPGEWQDQNLVASEGIINMASALLRHLSLPEMSSMLSLENLGKSFRCDPCTPNKVTSDAMTWSTLVWHFFKEQTAYDERERKGRELDIDVPLRNLHDLEEAAESRKPVASMSPSAKRTFESSPHDIKGQAYAGLSRFSLKDWGYCTWGSYLRVNPIWGKGPSNFECDESDDEETPIWTEDDGGHSRRCQYCKKLEIEVIVPHALSLGSHLKRIYGVGFYGEPLKKKSKAGLQV